MGHAALDRDAQVRDVLLDELDRVVLAGPDRLGEVLADLVRVDVERGRELDVADVVPAEIDVHEARHARGRVGVLVVVDALHERVRAVADADDGDPDLLVLVAARTVGAQIDSFAGGGTVGLRNPARRRSVTGFASSERTWKMRWKTVMTAITAST